MIVLDASAVVELLLGSPTGLRVEARVRASSPFVAAPHIVDVEVTHVLRKLVFRRQLDEKRAGVALGDFIQLRILRWPHDTLLARIWAMRDNLTAYDAAYVALAESLDAPLLTCDRKLAGGSGHWARIEAV